MKQSHNQPPSGLNEAAQAEEFDQEDEPGINKASALG